MHGTQQNWNSVWQGSLWQPHRPYDQPAPPGWCRIDPGPDAATSRVPAASREDSRPQAILKFQPCNSFNYRVRYEPQLHIQIYFKMLTGINIWVFFQTIIHWTSLMLSILFYFAFILIYNSFCITCFGLQNPFWVIHHTMGTAEFWLLILVSCVLALLPRYVFFKKIFDHKNSDMIQKT